MENKYMEALEKFTESVNDALQEIQTALNRRDTKTNNGHNSFTFSLARVRMIAQAGLASVVFCVGDIIISQHELGAIAWRIVDVEKYSVKLHMVHPLEKMRSEVGLGDEAGVHEGDPLPYFTSNESRKKTYDGDCDSAFWWLRSPDSGYARHMHLVGTSGELDDHNACSSYGVAAGCTIR